MTNQPGSAMWTCAACGAMASTLDSNCPNCRAARGTTPLVSAVQQSAVGPTTVPLSAVAVGSAAGVFRRLGRYMVEAPRIKAGDKQPSRGVAIALAFFLGFCGAQYFYMGRRILAVLSVAFCWTGYPAMMGFLEAMRMLFMTDNEFRQACA